jgi:hypothetical protein
VSYGKNYSSSESVSSQDQFVLLLAGVVVVFGGGLAWLGDRTREWALEHHVLVLDHVVVHVAGDAGIDWPRLVLFVGGALLAVMLMLRRFLLRRRRSMGGIEPGALGK